MPDTRAGKILFAENDGTYVLKLLGDVRLTLCNTLDEFFDKMFRNPAYRDVVVDLTDADNVDSTTLGLLAKLALRVQRERGHRPHMVSTNPDISRVIRSMGFSRIFELCDDLPCEKPALGTLPEIPASEQEAREKVLEAHRALMDVCDENKTKFKDLVNIIESDC